MHQFSSVQSVVSDSLRPHGLPHARPPCPSITPGIYPNSCPLSRWCYPTISSSVVPFSSRLQSFPVSGSFQMSQFFPSGGQSTGVFGFNMSPSNEHSGLISFRMDWLYLAVQGTLKSLLQHHSSKASILEFSFLEKSVNHFKTWDVFKIPSQHITDQRCINTSFVTQMLLLGDLPICFWRLIWLTSLCKVVRA